MPAAVRFCIISRQRAGIEHAACWPMPADFWVISCGVGRALRQWWASVCWRPGYFSVTTDYGVCLASGPSKMAVLVLLRPMPSGLETATQMPHCLLCCCSLRGSTSLLLGARAILRHPAGHKHVKVLNAATERIFHCVISKQEKYAQPPAYLPLAFATACSRAFLQAPLLRPI